MASKTTFIKLVGIHLILSRTLDFCFARSATLPDAGVMAVIRGEHSLESSKSHYFAEVTAIQIFIERVDRGTCRLFLIDELFNGTNTVECLAAGRAVLERLGRSAQVLVTTHNVELQDDVTEPYDLYYFEEDPDVDGWFDYRLQPGRTVRRNAIQLLARNGFPADLADALGYARTYASDRDQNLTSDPNLAAKHGRLDSWTDRYLTPPAQGSVERMPNMICSIAHTSGGATCP